MKNWATLEPDAYCLVGTHRYTKGRARKIDRIVIHHNAANNWSARQIVDMWNASRPASAHYQIEADGRVVQLVNDWDTAWHAANADINSRSIGIEHANISGPPRWQISDKTIEEGAHLVAALCHAYKLGRPVWGKNVFPHSKYTSTSCPHQLDVGGEDHATYMRRAQYWYDQMGKPASKPQLSKPDTGKKEPTMSLSHAEQQTAAHQIRDNQIQLRGPNLEGWDVPRLVEQYRKRGGDKGTLVELVAVLLTEVRQLRTQVEEYTRRSTS